MADDILHIETHFELGKDAERTVGCLVSRFSGTKALVVFGPGSLRRSTLCAGIYTALDRSLLDHVALCGVNRATQLELVREGIDFVRDEHVDFVLSVGGNEVIDAAKAIAAGALYRGDILDLFCEEHAIRAALPVGCVVTGEPSGAESTSACSLYVTGHAGALTVCSPVLQPSFAVVAQSAA